MKEWRVSCGASGCERDAIIASADRPSCCDFCGAMSPISVGLLPGTSFVSEHEVVLDEQPTHRRRGKPRVPPDMRRKSVLPVSLTEEEHQRYRILAAQSGFKNPQEWARDLFEKAYAASNTGVLNVPLGGVK